MRRRHQNLSFSGSIHFITTVTSKRGSWFTDEITCIHILTLFEKLRQQYHLSCYGYVLMPDHLHALLVQDNDGESVPLFMNAFKKWTSRRYRERISDARTLWARGYDDVPVPGSDAARTKIEYMHFNPIRRGLVNEPSEYRWSSIHDYYGSRQGIITVSLV